MVVADKTRALTITGDGNVIEAIDGVVAIGSGGSYALAAARAFMQIDDLTAMDVGKIIFYLFMHEFAYIFIRVLK